MELLVPLHQLELLINIIYDSLMTLSIAFFVGTLLILEIIGVKKPQGISSRFGICITGKPRKNSLLWPKKRISHVEIIFTSIVQLAIFVNNPLREM